MKHFWKVSLLLTVCFIVFCSTCFAQDVIVTKDSKRIDAKVLEVNIDNIRYKNLENEDGPVYTILKSDVATILYQNGQVDVFEPEKVMPSASMYDYIALMDNEDLPFKMRLQNPALYQKYKNGERMGKDGDGLLLAGLPLVMIGTIIVVYGFGNDNEKPPVLGYGLLAIGGICIAVGLPVSIVGKSKQNSALKEFHQQCYSASTLSHFRFNLNANGVGLSYVFGNK
jgi:hypothetical protein